MSRGQRPVSVRRTPDFAADLEVLQRGGLSASDAVRQAVRLIAQAHRTMEQLAAHDGQFPEVLSISTTDLTRPYDTVRHGGTGVARVAQDGGEGR